MTSVPADPLLLPPISEVEGVTPVTPRPLPPGGPQHGAPCQEAAQPGAGQGGGEGGQLGHRLPCTAPPPGQGGEQGGPVSPVPVAGDSRGWQGAAEDSKGQQGIAGDSRGQQGLDIAGSSKGAAGGSKGNVITWPPAE